MIRRKKIDVDFTVTNKEREQYEWYVCTAFSMSDSPPRLVISQQNLGMVNVVIRLVQKLNRHEIDTRPQPHPPL